MPNLEELAKKYGGRALPATGPAGSGSSNTNLDAIAKRYGGTSVTVQPQPTGFINKLGKSFGDFGSFVAEDITKGGAPTAGGIGGIGQKIFQNILGSGGVAGLATDVPRFLKTSELAKEQIGVQESRKGLTDSALKLIDLANNTQDPNQKQRLFDLARESIFQGEEAGRVAQDIAEETPKVGTIGTELKRISGQALNTATTLGGFASSAGATALQPVQSALHSKTIVDQGIQTFMRTAGLRALTSGVQAGTISAASALSEDKDFGEIAKRAGQGFAFGTILSGLWSLSKYGLKQVAESFVDNAVGSVRRADIKSDILTQARQDVGFTEKTTLAQDFLDEGQVNTGKGLIRTSLKTLKATGESMDDVLQGKNGTKPIDMTGIPDKFNRLIEDTKAALGDKAAKALEELQKLYLGKAFPGIVDAKVGAAVVKGTIPAKEAVNLYRSIYRVLPDKAWQSATPELAPAKEALKSVALELSSRVKKAIPEMEKLNFMYGLWSEVQDNVLSRLAASGRAFPSIVGLAKSGLEKTLGSIPVKLLIGFALNKLAESGINPAISESARQLLFQAAQEKAFEE